MSEEQEAKLNCLGGQPAPAELKEGWSAVETVPSGPPTDQFWELLGRFLSEPGHPGHDALLNEFCRRHELEPPSVVRAMETCDLLLSRSAALDLNDSLFQHDVEALAGGKTAQGVLLARHYAGVRPALRRRIYEDTLSDHGKVLIGLDWRLDRVEASDRGNKLSSNVIFLTLNYREREEIQRVSLQLTPEAVQMLKTFTDRFGGPS